MSGLLGDHGDRLDRRRTGADDADALAGEVDPLVGPRPVWYVAPAKISSPSSPGRFGVDRHPVAITQKRAVSRVALVGGHGPRRRALVEDGRLDPRLELDVAPQVEPVGDEVEVAQDLGLRRRSARSTPLPLQLLGEAVRVLDALDVAARAGVAVPVPRAADAVAGLEGSTVIPISRSLYSM